MRSFLAVLLCLIALQVDAAPFRQTCPGKSSLCQPQVAVSATVCSLDTPNGFGSESTSLVIPVSTSANVDVVVIGSYLQSASSPPTTSGVSGCSLTWTHRTGAATAFLSGGAWSNLDEWYAVTSSPLSACNVTVTAAGGAVAFQRITYFAFTGINSSTPFDSNASLPAITPESSGTYTTLTTTGISTTNASTCMFSFIRTVGAAGTFTPPTGWTTLGAAGTAMAFYYKVFSSVQSSISVAWAWTTANNSAGAITDAVQSAR